MTAYLDHLGDYHKEADCTALYAKDCTNASAWQLSDGTFADADDVKEFTGFEVEKNVYDDIADANKVLTKTFFSFFARHSFDGDTVAMREAFNCWTDGLCRDGIICTDTYEQCELEEE